MRTAVVNYYLETLLWTGTLLGDVEYEGETYRGGTSLDDIIGVDAIPASIVAESKRDLEGFQGYCEEALGFNPFEVFDSESVAHDFALSRNGHGAGFFDGDYFHEGKQYCNDLQSAAKTFGSHDLEVYSDGEGGILVDSRG